MPATEAEAACCCCCCCSPSSPSSSSSYYCYYYYDYDYALLARVAGVNCSYGGGYKGLESEKHLEAMPGLSVTQSGKFMKKNAVCGRLYLNLITCREQQPGACHGVSAE